MFVFDLSHPHSQTMASERKKKLKLSECIILLKPTLENSSTQRCSFVVSAGEKELAIFTGQFGMIVVLEHSRRNQLKCLLRRESALKWREA